MGKANRTLKIEKEKSGFIPIEPDKEIKQRLTINSNGIVWFTSYGLTTGDSWKYAAMRKIRSKITLEQANNILDKAESLLNNSSMYDGVQVCDANSDKITVIFDSGVFVSKYLYEEVVDELADLYDKIRDALKIPLLLEFDTELNIE